MKKKRTRVQSKRKQGIVQKKNFIGYKFKLILTYGIIFCLICMVCLFFSSMILFKIKEIVVQGDKVCESQVLIEKSGIKIEDNLFFVNTKVAADKIEKSITEIGTVTMQKKFPNKLVIDVKKAEKVFCVEFDEKYFEISDKNKVLACNEERDTNLIFLDGIKFEPIEVGKKIVYTDKSVEKKISEITEKMKLNDLPKISELNFNNDFSFLVTYDNRIEINFGFYENMDYKIKTASEIINNKLGAAETGVLDLSEVSKEKRSYFTPSY